MKLQINTKGSWRDVFPFDAERTAEVQDAAASLSRAAGGLRLRVLQDDGTPLYLTDHGAFRAISLGDQ